MPRSVPFICIIGLAYGQGDAPSGSSASATDLSAAQGALDALFLQHDVNDRFANGGDLVQGKADGQLSLAELGAAITGLGPDLVAAFESSGLTSATLFSEADTNSDERVTKDEIVAAVYARGSRTQEDFVSALTMKPSVEEITISAPPTEITQSMDEISLRIVCSGQVSDIFLGQRKAIKTYLATLMRVPEAQLTLTFLPGSVIISATAFFPDAATAVTSRAYVTEALSSSDAASTALGLQVTEVPTVAIHSRVSGKAEKVTATAASATIYVLLLVLFGVGASQTSKMKRAANNEPFTSCTTNGCCGYLAMQAWAVRGADPHARLPNPREYPVPSRAGLDVYLRRLARRRRGPDVRPRAGRLRSPAVHP